MNEEEQTNRAGPEEQPSSGTLSESESSQPQAAPPEAGVVERAFVEAAQAGLPLVERCGKPCGEV